MTPSDIKITNEQTERCDNLFSLLASEYLLVPLNSENANCTQISNEPVGRTMRYEMIMQFETTAFVVWFRYTHTHGCITEVHKKLKLFFVR